MVLYICERCGYETMRKSNFKSHLNRKKICQPLLEDLDREFIKFKHGFGSEKYETAEFGGYPPKSFKQIHNTTTIFKQKIKQNDPPKTTLFKQNKQKLSKTTPQKPPFLSKKLSKKGVLNFSDDPDLTVSKKVSHFFCDFCERKFTSKKHKYRHQKHNCKMRNEIEKSELEIEIYNLKNEIEKMKKDGVTTVQNINNIQNNITNNIIINNYKDENVDYISNKVLEKLITGSPYSSIPRLTECIHFNTDHPENHNLAITNIRSQFARIRLNDMWQVKFLNELLEELINTKFHIIDEYYEYSGIKDKMTGWKVDNYEEYRNLLFKDSKIRDRIKKRLFESIINFTKELGLKCK